MSVGVLVLSSFCAVNAQMDDLESQKDSRAMRMQKRSDTFEIDSDTLMMAL